MGARRMVVGTVAAVVGVLGLLPAAASAAEVDTTPPVLASVSFSAPTLTAPGTATLTLDATDDVGIVRSEVTFLEDGSHRYVYVADTSSPLTVARYFSQGDANGTWRPYEVRLTDAAGNYSIYRLDGRYVSRPASTTTTHGVDLSGASFVVSGALDRTPPTLTSLQKVTAAGRAGEASTWSWSVTDVGSLPATIRATLTNPMTGDTVSTPLLPASPGSGTFSITVPHAGEWRMTSVEVVDSKDNKATYLANGQVQVPYALMPLTHSLPFANLGLGVAPNAFTPRVVERAGRLTLVLPDTVSPANLTRVRIVASPSGVVVEQPLGASASLALDVAGLPNGVTQSLSVTLNSTWGDSPVATVSGRPVLSRNVTGTGDVTGDGRADIFATRQPGLEQDRAVWAYPGTGAGAVRPKTAYIPTDRSPFCDSIAAVDTYVLGSGELLCRTDELASLREDGSGTVLGSRGWSTMRWVDGGFSLNGDAYPDVVAMNAKGELLLYPKTSTDRLLAPTRIGTGWQSMISVISAGDLNGDRKNDIAAVDASGRLWLYPGNGKGGVTTRRQIGSGWQSMGALLPMRDFDRDGKADLGGIGPDGDLRLYRGTGTGGVRAGVFMGWGWNMYL
ncbi:FG-GAP repeat domain-containing protein [Phycicoccus avicenniae]|uniref:FG-GAP repeat domain-containing protein n=1 Tax=Phycicoccus avicenniae TaxID=2828860 RepID=UPI003D2E6892